MTRRTPIFAFILAPLVLYLLAQLWLHVVVPVARTAWRSDAVVERRLESGQPAVRIAAAKDAATAAADDTELVARLVQAALTDENSAVREAAVTSLGWIGEQHPLPAEARQALVSMVTTEQEIAMLSAAIGAVGRSASQNRYPDEVAERIVRSFDEKHLEGLYPRAAEALGQLGAAQPLPDAVFETLNARFAEPRRPGEREYLANSFRQMAEGRVLPLATLDLLVEAFPGESNYRIRRAIVYALVYSEGDYPGAEAFVSAATGDPHRDVVAAAEHGLRIIENERRYAGTDPLSLATDATRSVEDRLHALQVIQGTRMDPSVHEPIAMLARDRNTEVAVAAIDMFRYMARDADGEFEQRVLIPELGRAMSASDPRIRTAAFGALSTISRNRPAWLRVADFPAQLEAGANDPDPKVRVVVLVIMLREAGGTPERDAVIERGLADPDPYVRSNATSWLGSTRVKAGQRDALIARAKRDSDPDVRRSAQQSQERWDTRDRAWPIEAWRLLRKGEFGIVGMQVLIAVSVATPALICGIFLIYYTARFLTYLQRRQWRAAAVVPVLLIWAGASYGMFMLLFVAGFAGDADAGEIAILAGIIWAAIAAYAALGWGMHYVVRR